MSTLNIEEVSSLLEEAVDILIEWDISEMTPHDSFNLGLLSGQVNGIVKLVNEANE